MGLAALCLSHLALQRRGSIFDCLHELDVGISARERQEAPAHAAAGTVDCELADHFSRADFHERVEKTVPLSRVLAFPKVKFQTSFAFQQDPLYEEQTWAREGVPSPWTTRIGCGGQMPSPPSPSYLSRGWLLLEGGVWGARAF